MAKITRRDEPLIRKWLNCQTASVDADGDVWVADPMAGHWLKHDRISDYLAWRAGVRRAKRQGRYISSGRQIACVIRDPDALDALDRLAEKHGGVTAAVTAALRSSAHLHHLDDARVRSSP